MSNVKEVTVYEVSGTLFRTREEAEAQDRRDTLVSDLTICVGTDAMERITDCPQMVFDALKKAGYK